MGETFPQSCRRFILFSRGLGWCKNYGVGSRNRALNIGVGKSQKPEMVGSGEIYVSASVHLGRRHDPSSTLNFVNNITTHFAQHSLRGIVDQQLTTRFFLRNFQLSSFEGALRTSIVYSSLVYSCYFYNLLDLLLLRFQDDT